MNSLSISVDRRREILQEARRALAQTRERDRVLAQLGHQAKITRDRFLNDLTAWDRLRDELESIAVLDRQLRTLLLSSQSTAHLFQREWDRIVNTRHLDGEPQEEVKQEISAPSSSVSSSTTTLSLQEQILAIKQRQEASHKEHQAFHQFLQESEQTKQALKAQIASDERACEELRGRARMIELQQEKIVELERKIESEKQLLTEEAIENDEDDTAAQLAQLLRRKSQAERTLQLLDEQVIALDNKANDLQTQLEAMRRDDAVDVDTLKMELQRELEVEFGIPDLEQQLCEIELQLASNEDLRVALAELSVEKQRLQSTEAILQSIQGQIDQH